MRRLGAILAGGRSSRFGTDKALALWQGHSLLDWARLRLAPYVEHILVCGRDGGLIDRPGGQMGPLAGLNAALHAGREAGFDAVLSLPCDTPTVDDALLARLCATGGAAYLDDCPVIGLWPTDLADALDAHLAGDDRSMRSWTRRIGAHALALDAPLPNINRPSDLAALSPGTG